MFKFPKISHYIALFITLISLIWLFSGVFVTAEKPSLMSVKKEIIHNVTTKISRATEHQQSYKIYGNAKAHKIISIKSEINGKINKIHSKEGSEIKAKEKIFTIDTNQYKAEFEEAKANYNSKKIILSSTKKLFQKGLSSKTTLANHRADFQAAEAKLKTAELNFNNTKIMAPFDGRIEKIHIENGEIIEAYRSELAILINDDKILVNSYIAEKLITNFNIINEIEVDFINQIKKNGTLNFISSIADPLTKTYLIEILIDNSDKIIKDGMTAEINFKLKSVTAHKIKSSSLTLDIDGNIGIKAINQEKLVEFIPAQILAEEGEFIWLTNLPEIIEIITIGHGFVQSGDQVSVKKDESY